jgi:hypothetical protein
MFNRLSTCFLVFFAALTLNASVDLPDYLLNTDTAQQANNDFDEVDTITELVCEHFFDMHCDFPDKKNDNHNAHHHFKKTSVLKFNWKTPQFSCVGYQSGRGDISSSCQPVFTDFAAEILSPPPQLS